MPDTHGFSIVGSGADSRTDLATKVAEALGKQFRETHEIRLFPGGVDDDYAYDGISADRCPHCDSEIIEISNLRHEKVYLEPNGDPESYKGIYGQSNTFSHRCPECERLLYAGPADALVSPTARDRDNYLGALDI